MLRQLTRRLPGWAWALLVILLPITSMPLVARLVHSDAVAGPSGLILFALLVAWFLPALLRGAAIPRQSLPLLAFVLVAVLSTLLSAFLAIPPYKDQSIVRNSVEGLLTLAVGVSFYLVASTWLSSESRIRATLRLVNWSGLVVLIWSLAQAAAWYTGNHYPDWMRSIHELYSIGPLFRQRASGFALEPSWLAHQLNLLYLPFWLASSALRFTVHRFKVLWFHFEDLLLVGGVLALLLTLSRVGLLAFLLMVGFLLVRLNLRLTRWIKSRVLRRWQGDEAHARQRSVWVSVFVLTALALVYGLVLLGVGFVLSRVDPLRMGKLFDCSLGGSNDLLRCANQLMFASRVVYWQAGWGVFNQHPWMGVGLGNAGFYFPQTLPGYAWGLVEVRDLLFRSTNLLNIKSFWVRLLAETGIVGFACFVSWFFVLWLSARSIVRSSRPLFRMVAAAGSMTLIAYLVEGFSVDTFAFPYLWLAAGLLTAAAVLEAREIRLPVEIKET